MATVGHRGREPRVLSSTALYSRVAERIFMTSHPFRFRPYMYVAFCLVCLAAPSSFGQALQIPAKWIGADPKLVLADLDFSRLHYGDRVKIMEQLDPKFARLSHQKQTHLLYVAEKASFPKSTPRKALVWDPQCGHCGMEIHSDLGLGVAKKIDGEGISLKVSMEAGLGWYFAVNIAILNQRTEPLPVLLEAFTVMEVKPKRQTFLFEYPDRVSGNLLTGFWNSSPPNPNIQTTIMGSSTTAGPNAPQSNTTTRTTAVISTPGPNTTWSSDDSANVMRFARNIQETALQSTELGPGEATKGTVWFQDDHKAMEVIVRIPFGDIAFDVPFSLRKR